MENKSKFFKKEEDDDSEEDLEKEDKISEYFYIIQIIQTIFEYS